MSKFDEHIRRGSLAKQAKRFEHSLEQLGNGATASLVIRRPGQPAIEIPLDDEDLNAAKILRKYLRKLEREMEE